jgi:hypothetical protein
MPLHSLHKLSSRQNGSISLVRQHAKPFFKRRRLKVLRLPFLPCSLFLLHLWLSSAPRFEPKCLPLLVVVFTTGYCIIHQQQEP